MFKGKQLVQNYENLVSLSSMISLSIQMILEGLFSIKQYEWAIFDGRSIKKILIFENVIEKST